MSKVAWWVISFPPDQNDGGASKLCDTYKIKERRNRWFTRLLRSKEVSPWPMSGLNIRGEAGTISPHSETTGNGKGGEGARIKKRSKTVGRQ